MSTLETSNFKDRDSGRSVPAIYPVDGSAKARCVYRQDTGVTFASFNISSFVDVAVGQTTTNFASAFQAAYGYALGAGSKGSSGIRFISSINDTTNSTDLLGWNSNAAADIIISAVLVGDLA